MASIFTYETEPPRVSSPWLTPVDSPKPLTPQPRERASSARLEDHGVTRLEAEPQEGPLLWRLQQSSPYHDFSTSDLVLPKLPDVTRSLEKPSKPAKLLAGLEQSRGALYEIGVSDDGTFVGLTQDEMDESLNNLRAMAASLGCIVEIVRMVIVGDCEWQESPAASSVTPKFPSMQENPRPANPMRSDQPAQMLHHEAHLWVAEALVSPNLGPRKSEPPSTLARPTAMRYKTVPPAQHDKESTQNIEEAREGTEQLRITLTGPTTSGKSSLLGTLSTATLDNGRGKSRLSLLKHRHEIASGMTSSVAQELIGYKGEIVINYASGNVTSWTDIHFLAKNGRLVFVSDSAGYWRYRRTIVRGLIGWAPHWTILCIAADDGESVPNSTGGTVSSQETLRTAGIGVDLGKAHLELCLKLDRPLAVVITKLDLASKTNLRQTLSKILSIIKATGRMPSIIAPDQAKNVEESGLNTITQSNTKDPVREVVEKIKIADDPTSVIPIIMTSAAKGTGIRSLHALLLSLPIPPAPQAHDLTGPALNPEQPACLFHIEDVFGLPASLELMATNMDKYRDAGVVVAGHLRFGKFSVGDVVVIGPFPAESDMDDESSSCDAGKHSPNSFGNSLPHTSTAELPRISSARTSPASIPKGEWLNAHIVSLRNLRLPVHTLNPGQVGTVGLVFDIPDELVSNGPFERTRAPPPRVRKGQVMAIPSQHMTEGSLQAASRFSASFEDSDINSITTGTIVVVYAASIRAAAKVLKVVPHVNNDSRACTAEDELGDVFGLNGHKQEEAEAEPAVFGMDGLIDVTFELLTSREWLELGEQVLVMPGQYITPRGATPWFWKLEAESGEVMDCTMGQKEERRVWPVLKALLVES
ncbi:GTP-binding protein [Marssonina coronariae]|uniref:GTP-binding protein n=1 Tax=Diplocarpon coronariae TaxID=2795749 RepID=A0A218Z8C3_9HELO|nr:GTP-binding protein [Marssonina coronariae]